MHFNLLTKKTKILQLIIIGIFHLNCSLYAQQTDWINPGTGNWEDDVNWSAGEPDASTIANIDNGGTAVIAVGGTAALLNVGLSTALNNTLIVNNNCLFLQSSIGTNPNSNGTALLNGVAATWLNVFDATIGNSGTGLMTIQNGAQLFSTDVFIGNAVSSNGTLNVTGPGSNLTADNIFIGNSGIGILTIQNGSEVDSTTAVLGSNIGSVGSVFVQDIGSQWLNAANITIGSQGVGSLNVNSGGFVSSSSVEMNKSFLNLAGTLGNQGTLNTQGIASTGVSNLINFDGGILQAAGDNPDFLSGFIANQVNSGNGGAFIDTQNFTIGIQAPISGNGPLNKLGSGTLTLVGLNTYQGGTIISAGTLIGNSLTIPDHSILDNGTLIFDQNIDDVFTGDIAGSGILVKAGSARLTLLGNGSSFAGTTSVQSGDLGVNGSLGGICTVNPGAILSGVGILNQVFNSGTISPGNSIGTLHVASLVNNSNGNVLSEINGNGQADLISATGTVTLNGGQLRVVALPGFYLRGTTYTLIQAAGGLAGQFATSILPANLQLALNYLPQALILEVLGSGAVTTGLSGNPLRVAKYIGSQEIFTEDFLTVVENLNSLDPSQLFQALDQLHPALFQALAMTVGDTTHLINTTFMDRLVYLRNITCKDNCGSCRCHCGGAWTAGVADFIRQGKSEGLRRFTTANEGFSLGYDNELGDFLVGLGGGYTHSNLHWGHGTGKARIHGYYIGAYASKYNDCYYMDASLLSFVNHHRVHRHIHFANINRHAKNNHYSYGLSPHLGLGMFLNWCNIDIIPFCAFDYYLVQQNRMRENGANSLDLHVKRNQAHLLRAEAGVNFSRCFKVCKGLLQPNASISWVGHRVLGGKKYISSFKDFNNSFAVYGTDQCFNQLLLGMGLTYRIHERLAVNAWFDVELGQKRQEEQVNLEINYLF